RAMGLRRAGGCNREGARHRAGRRAGQRRPGNSEPDCGRGAGRCGMRRLLIALLCALAPAAAYAQAASPPAGNVPETQIERDVRALAAELRCPVCQGLSLQDSPSELSQEMKDVIRAQLEEGQTREQVKAYFVSKYGE